MRPTTTSPWRTIPLTDAGTDAQPRPHGQTEPYDKGNGYSHIAFTVDDLEGTVARLQEGGVKLTVEPKTMAVDGHDYRIAFVEDPDGYRVELVERGTMKVGDMIQ